LISLHFGPLPASSEQLCSPTNSVTLGPALKGYRQPERPDLFPENTIFVNEILHDALLLLIDPAGK
jgi:hypothetical protein